MDRHRLVGMFEKACRDLEESLQPDVIMSDEVREKIIKNYDATKKKLLKALDPSDTLEYCSICHDTGITDKEITGSIGQCNCKSWEESTPFKMDIPPIEICKHQLAKSLCKKCQSEENK